MNTIVTHHEEVDLDVDENHQMETTAMMIDDVIGEAVPENVIMIDIQKAITILKSLMQFSPVNRKKQTCLFLR